MAILLSTEEGKNEFRLFWYSNEIQDRVENVNGSELHATRIVQGRLRLQVAGEPPREVVAGDEIILPARTAYTFTVLEAPAHIVCHYPAGPPADEVRPLAAPRNRPTIYDQGREWPFPVEEEGSE